MANNHGYISTIRATCENVDAFNCVGTIASDIDNGTVVTLSKMVQDSKKNVEGFEFEVAKANASTKYADAWVVVTPEVGDSLEMQLLNDPRYFYNKAGKPLSLKKLHADTDYIEADANCFTSVALPSDEETVVTVDSNGKFVAGSSAPAANLIYWDVVGFHEVAVGSETMKTVILRTRVSTGA